MKLSERAAALGYGLAYDVVVERFPPYEALRAEVAKLVSRSTPPGASRGETSVLDIACGLGNVCLHLGQLGFRVHGLDPVDRLIEVARRKHHAAGALPNVSFQRQDLASEPLSATFDVLVSMNTLYWHPAPEALLRACHRALAPGGRAVFLTYNRAARVRRTAGDPSGRRQPRGLALAALARADRRLRAAPRRCATLPGPRGVPRHAARGGVRNHRGASLVPRRALPPGLGRARSMTPPASALPRYSPR